MPGGESPEGVSLAEFELPAGVEWSAETVPGREVGEQVSGAGEWPPGELVGFDDAGEVGLDEEPVGEAAGCGFEEPVVLGGVLEVRVGECDEDTTAGFRVVGFVVCGDVRDAAEVPVADEIQVAGPDGSWREGSVRSPSGRRVLLDESA